MATLDPVPPIRSAWKPSFMLGFCLWVLPVPVFLVVAWQLGYIEGGPKEKLSREMWIALLSASIAMYTWLGTSLISLRNSIKQHTITTLLEMRLSATYMDYADKVSGHFVDYDRRLKKDLRLPETELPTTKVDIAALRYILNYFEFLAVGIAKGDFDEDMLSSSLRSILRKNVQMSRLYIKESQAQNPKLYQHMAWLHDRWCEDQPRISLYQQKRGSFFSRMRRKIIRSLITRLRHYRH